MAKIGGNPGNLEGRAMMDTEKKYTKFDMVFPAVIAGILTLVVGYVLGAVIVNLEMRHAWDEHAAEQCYPHALYEAKLNDLSWMCAK